MRKSALWEDKVGDNSGTPPEDIGWLTEIFIYSNIPVYKYSANDVYMYKLFWCDIAGDQNILEEEVAGEPA